ncbi:O-acyltransferase [Saccharomycopsis crataegensis]|uniref:O-acyltransferase n=1 Tax=Saccharomycopsis crataegensis TaxID=43959 RepID=A0AAV5QLB0_9ASCO|nr:O-acyltransferase [Saccharomycopsis crataegensis]
MCQKTKIWEISDQTTKTKTLPVPKQPNNKLSTVFSMSKFFGLQALDSRLGPPQDQAKLKRIIASVPPKSRWSTLEFKFYIAVFIIVVPLMLKQGIEISLSSHPNYPKYSHLLSDGWIFGRKVDNSDVQYSFFRNNFFLLVVLMISHVLIKSGCYKFFKIEKLTFDMVFGVIFLALAHGMNSLKILIHIVICYFAVRLAISMDKKHSGDLNYNEKFYRCGAISFIWVYGIAALYINDRYRDFQLFGAISPSLGGLDKIRGIIHRWDIFYNFTLLRTLSYNMDYIWRYYDLKNNIRDSTGIQLKELELSKKRTISQEELNLVNESNEIGAQKSYGGDAGLNSDLTDRERQAYPWSIYDYNFGNHLAYVLYTPLFIAGPILTFNDYLYQCRHTLSSINFERSVGYALRFITDLLTMEFMLHFMYVVAIAKVKLYEGYTPFQISMIGLLNLNVIWLKLLIPWRFFRLWALLDNMDPPENMIRCVDNNYSAMAFWRAWHRSYNKWVTRYIYIPLGGSKNRVFTSLAVFSFVAVWHDIEFKLLIWGWLIVLFLVPEIFLSSYFRKFNDQPWYRHVCGMGSVVNIWLMMIANIYGFCLGHDGTVGLLKNMLGTFDGGLFFITCSGCLFVGVQVMYESRDSEKRRGIDLRC